MQRNITTAPIIFLQNLHAEGLASALFDAHGVLKNKDYVHIWTMEQYLAAIEKGERQLIFVANQGPIEALMALAMARERNPENLIVAYTSDFRGLGAAGFDGIISKSEEKDRPLPTYVAQKFLSGASNEAIRAMMPQL